MEEKFNGWKNYATWAIFSWISNDEGLYKHYSFRSALVSQSELAQEIKDYIEDKDELFGTYPLSNHCDVYSDLLDYAIEQCDWYEVASYFYDEKTDKPDEKTKDDEIEKGHYSSEDKDWA